jgi:hypothetical protein
MVWPLAASHDYNDSRSVSYQQGSFELAGATAADNTSSIIAYLCSFNLRRTRPGKSNEDQTKLEDRSFSLM